jgi:hypothetical protein
MKEKWQGQVDADVGRRERRERRRKRGKRMYSCSVCGKPGTRKVHAPPCDPNMKEKWQGQVDADVSEGWRREMVVLGPLFQKTLRISDPMMLT